MFISAVQFYNYFLVNFKKKKLMNFMTCGFRTFVNQSEFLPTSTSQFSKISVSCLFLSFTCEQNSCSFSSSVIIYIYIFILLPMRNFPILKSTRQLTHLTSKSLAFMKFNAIFQVPCLAARNISGLIRTKSSDFVRVKTDVFGYNLTRNFAMAA